MVLDAIRSYWQTLRSDAYNPYSVLVELLIIGVVVYTILRFLHGTRGARLLRGLIVLLIIGFLGVRVLAERLAWDRILVLYQSFAWLALLTVLIVFQPELRRGITRVGETRWLRRWTGAMDEVVATIASAAAILSKQKIGALIAIERDVPLGAWADSGVALDAKVSIDLLHTIFWPNSALHDMGVVIQHDRVLAAGVQFPLAETGTVDRRLGSRHRAAVGLSTESDALVVVVSEETGTISIADRGRLIRGVSPEALAGTLRDRLQRRGHKRRRRRWRPGASADSAELATDASAGKRLLSRPLVRKTEPEEVPK